MDYTYSVFKTYCCDYQRNVYFSHWIIYIILYIISYTYTYVLLLAFCCLLWFLYKKINILIFRYEFEFYWVIDCIESYDVTNKNLFVYLLTFKSSQKWCIGTIRCAFASFSIFLLCSPCLYTHISCLVLPFLSSSISFYFLSCSHFISTNIIGRGGSRKRWKKEIIRATEDRKATLSRKRGKESIGLIWLRLQSPLDSDSCTHVYILHTYMQMYVYTYICTSGSKTSRPSVHSNGPHPVINKIKFAAAALNRMLPHERASRQVTQNRSKGELDC